MIYSILYREQSPKWLDKLAKKIEDNQNKQFLPSTVLALYIRRKFFVSYWPIRDNNDELSDQSGALLATDQSSTLTFSDWIDLLLNGNFRNPTSVKEWPMKFH
jgi:hypothetical protein